MTAVHWAAVFLLGGAGTVARFLVDRAVSRRTASPFPFGILVVNLSGALVLGFLAGLALDHRTAMLIGTGFVGSYTTFSTWMFQTQRLATDGRHRAAVANLAVSVVLGLAAAWVGAGLSHLL